MSPRLVRQVPEGSTRRNGEVNVNSVLIMGRTETPVVRAQGTRSAALRLADVIASKDLSLGYVYLTHPHLDHSQGASSWSGSPTQSSHR